VRHGKQQTQAHRRPRLSRRNRQQKGVLPAASPTTLRPTAAGPWPAPQPWANDRGRATARPLRSQSWQTWMRRAPGAHLTCATRSLAGLAARCKQANPSTHSTPHRRPVARQFVGSPGQRSSRSEGPIFGLVPHQKCPGFLGIPTYRLPPRTDHRDVSQRARTRLALFILRRSHHSQQGGRTHTPLATRPTKGGGRGARQDEEMHSRTPCVRTREDIRALR